LKLFERGTIEIAALNPFTHAELHLAKEDVEVLTRDSEASSLSLYENGRAELPLAGSEKMSIFDVLSHAHETFQGFQENVFDDASSPPSTLMGGSDLAPMVNELFALFSKSSTPSDLDVTVSKSGETIEVSTSSPIESATASTATAIAESHLKNHPGDTKIELSFSAHTKSVSSTTTLTGPQGGAETWKPPEPVKPPKPVSPPSVPRSRSQSATKRPAFIPLEPERTTEES